MCAALCGGGQHASLAPALAELCQDKRSVKGLAWRLRNLIILSFNDPYIASWG